MRITNLVGLLALITWSTYGQINQSTEQWHQDVQFLKETVHNDYSFLFKKISSTTFNKMVETLHRDIPNLAEHEILVGIAQLVSSFGYGHTSLWLSGWDPTNMFGFHQMPFNLYYFSDGVFIQGVHERFKHTLGAEVLEVEGVPVLEALEKVRPVVPVENEQFFKAFGIRYLGTPEVLHARGVKPELNDRVNLTLEKNGEVFQQEFTPVELSDYPFKYGFLQESGPWLDVRDHSVTPFWLKNLDHIYYKEYIEQQKALYVRHSQIQDDSIDIPAFYQQVFDFIRDRDVEKLILDVRLNGGGNNYKNKPIITGILGCDQINAHDKLFVILGRRTFSACQNLVNELHTYTEATFVGEPTGENINFFGDNKTIILPNSKVPIRLSFAWWQDKPQWENAPWLAPDIAVDMSFEHYKGNIDPVLEAIWNYNDSLGVQDPMEYLTELFQTGQQEKIPGEASRLVADPRYRYYPFEERINQAAYNLLNSGQVEPAISIFQMNTQLFPESANSWNSLAKAYWQKGDIDKATELYEKAEKMDPDGRVGENSRIMLERIKQQER
jgi:hypothetical protein